MIMRHEKFKFQAVCVVILQWKRNVFKDKLQSSSFKDDIQSMTNKYLPCFTCIHKFLDLFKLIAVMCQTFNVRLECPVLSIHTLPC